ncbi:homogentisate 1,2-dioxygenase [Metarhizium robertsii]|uniref:homogentisate 1,2-dioxygenase n=1 Tax=Metarhizium robertsii TaxID=568076 RepID=A0A0A1UT68_9HYPO|nr:homogentisate 1,2-dioxygenase [Metarhizium robertsii]
MPVTNFSIPEKYRYLNGSQSYHQTEAVPGALPVAANSPQKPPYGLYTKKLSGTAFIPARSENLQSWLYRILPSATHLPFERWYPFDMDNVADWPRGLRRLGGVGDPAVKSGLGIYIFVAGSSMPTKEAFYSSDGDFLIVLQQGVLDIQTEFGRKLGPIGSNGLANTRDFEMPAHTPFDVVAWHGNYYPYKYDLSRFNTIGSTSFDHPDPSIYTVLCNPSADFVIFPPRWLFMGLIMGEYDAKSGGGFRAAGGSLHNVMSAHGPDSDTHAKASNMELKPTKVVDGSMAFMFESPLMMGVTDWGLEACNKVQ